MKCFKQLGALALYYFATVAIAHEGHGGEEGHIHEEVENPDSDVHTLTKDTFKDFVATHPLILAECEFPHISRVASLVPTESVTNVKLLQSMPHGVVTARLWLQNTRLLRPS